MPRITVLGGSSVGSPELIRALAAPSVPPREAVPLEVVLQGRRAEKLEIVGRVCARMVGGGDRLTVRWTTDLGAALDGADVVLIQVRVGGYKARAFDETFPHEFGLPGEETMGPGGFANSLRTVPVVVDLGRAVQQYAPRAWVLNLTNPSSVIQLALQRTAALRVIGLCDSPVSMHEGIAGVLGAGPDRVQVEYVGMHHFGWITRVWHEGREVMREVLKKVEALQWISVPADLVRAIEAIPHPYMNYVLAPQAMYQRQQGRRPRAEELANLEDELLGEYRTWLATDDPHPPAGLARRRAVWYAKIIAPVIQHLLTDARAMHILNVLNRGTIPWLPEGAIVEVSTVLGSAGPRVSSPGAVPPDVVALTQHNCAYESLLGDAILEQSHEKAWRAMALNLLVRDAAQAKALLDRIWPTGGVPTGGMM
jgi:6-phospho-beta-glucosidase